MSNFITNEKEKNLSNRLTNLISVSKQIRALVGFCYFDGFIQLYDALRQNENLVFKLLIGLNLKLIGKFFVEVEYNTNSNKNKIFEDFLDNLTKYFSHPESDKQTVYENAKLLIKLIKQNRLIIRKTLKPNHSKLYLFDLNSTQVAAKHTFITGSSNLTRSGLFGQEEFNVEIKDYGYEEASKYFDERWKESLPITEDEIKRQKLLETLEFRTPLREITPFEAYCYVLKAYLDSYQAGDTKLEIDKLLKDRGYIPYRYQVDAIKQAIAILNAHNGVLLADVVGLGKTVMAAAIARLLGSRGIVLCPPLLIGEEDKTSGWRKYLKEFGLNDWEVFSTGKLEKVINAIKDDDTIEYVIIDEVHRFRNESTISYEMLKTICTGKKVICLTATPFNNKPQDLLSILKLFVNTRRSTLTLDDNLDYLFNKINSEFWKLHYIKKYKNHPDPDKKSRSKKFLKDIFNDVDVSDKKINEKIRKLAKQVREIIEPVTIRRNRKDLIAHPVYRKEVQNLSEVKPPEPIFYELDPIQDKFYDDVLQSFNNPLDGGKFRGAIYRPVFYEKGNVDNNLSDDSDLDEANKRTPDEVTQSNLYDLMRRLLVRRFESSFGAFYESLKNIRNLYTKILDTIEKTNVYVFNLKFIEKILTLLEQLDEEKSPDEVQSEIDNIILEYDKNNNDKRQKVYYLDNNFKLKDKFIQDIKSDIELIQNMIDEIENLDLLNYDPKYDALLNKCIQKRLSEEPNKKILVFTEFADTVFFLKDKLKEKHPHLFERTLFVAGNISHTLYEQIKSNFDPSHNMQNNDFDIIITTDKLSEGFNLNRAGIVVNYDIPWNPVRVIQRVGRINRIGHKLFDELEIYNFFPTTKGAQYADAKTAASVKMFMIHNILGEDARIFEPDEEPAPSRLFEILNQNPEDLIEESLYTRVYREFEEIKSKHPDILERIYSIPNRSKVVKASYSNDLTIIYQKNRIFFQYFDLEQNNLEPKEILIEELFEKIRSTTDDKQLKIDNSFWEKYGSAINYHKKIPFGESLTKKGLEARKNLDYIIKHLPNLPYNLNSFVQNLLDDIENYGSLSSYTISELAGLNFNDYDVLVETLKTIRDRLGENYFEKIKEIDKINSEKTVIISFMNKKV